jgi:hypothetical protein
MTRLRRHSGHVRILNMYGYVWFGTRLSYHLVYEDRLRERTLCY